MPDETWYPAPAKLNLMLHVTGRRADGYHELQTVFQLLDLCDTVAITLRDDGRIERPQGAIGVPPAADLAVRAAQALREHTGTALGANLFVTKRIPMGGGLGGGSSDAATTLVALNQLWSTGLDCDELAALGGKLGAEDRADDSLAVDHVGDAAGEQAEGLGDSEGLAEGAVGIGR